MPPTDTSCLGCRKDFPLIQPVQGMFCIKCAVLTQHPRTSDMFKAIEDWPQCIFCGDSWMAMPVTSPLQVCARLDCLELASEGSDAEPGGTQQEEPRESAVPRCSAHYFIEKMRAARNQGSQVATSDLNTAILRQQEQEIRNAAGVASKKMGPPNAAVPGVYVSVQVCLSGTPKRVNNVYGRSEHAVPGTTTLTDIQNRALKDFNETFTKSGRVPVDLCETTLRLSGNRQIEANKMSFSIYKWQSFALDTGLLDAHTNGKGKPKTPGAARAKLVNQFEIFVHEELYNERVDNMLGSMDGGGDSVAIGKRRTRAASVLAGPQGSNPKQPRVSQSDGSTMLRSLFALPGRWSSGKGLVLSTKTTLQVTRVAKITASGDPVFFKDSKKVAAFIEDEPFAKGASKVAYNATLSGLDDPFVLKRFFQMEGAEDSGFTTSGMGVDVSVAPFPLEEHNSEIQNELVCIERAAYFLKAFYAFCKERGVPAYDRFRFADAFLAQEIGPSTPASGYASQNAEDEYEYLRNSQGVMYLGERRLPNDVLVRFSGTLDFSFNHTEVKFQTLNAFTHYAFVRSNRQIVFADLQGSPDTLALDNGTTKDVFTLFDPMSHTTTGESGLGDHGKEGIAKFIAQHKCRSICEQLALDTDMPLLLPESEGEEESEREGKGKSESESEGDN